MRSTIIAISGMVGSGKSTLTDQLAKRLGVSGVQEKIGSDHPWLERYYASLEGRQRWALHSQLHFLATAVEDVRRTDENGGLSIVDGTIDEDAHVFASMAAEDGLMDGDEAGLYRRIYTQLLDSPGGRDPDVVVYLGATFGRAMERIAQRGRPTEQDIGLNYWSRVYGHYEVWARGYRRSPMLRLDVDDVDAWGDDAPRMVVEKLIRLMPSVEEILVGSSKWDGPAADCQEQGRDRVEDACRYDYMSGRDGGMAGLIYTKLEVDKEKEIAEVVKILTKDFAYVDLEGRRYGLNRNIVQNNIGEQAEVGVGDRLAVMFDPGNSNRITEAVTV